MESTSRHNKYIVTHNVSIDIFRFVVMLWIVLFHYTVRYNEIEVGHQILYPLQFENGGIIGVKIFFVLSGYFMTKGILFREDYGLKVYFKYLIQRYYRLWIPYFVACCIIYVWMWFFPLEGRTISFSIFVIDLFCILHPGVNYIDGAHWFLQTLFAVQIALALLLLIKQGQTRKYMLYALMFFSLIASVQILPSPLLHVVKEFYLFEIILGMTLFLVRMKDITAIIMAAIALIISAWGSLMFFAYIAIFCLLTFNYIQLPKHTSSIVFLGSLSYSWYLVHQNIGYSLQQMFVPSGNISFLWIILPLSVTLLLAFAINLICVLLHSKFQKWFSA